MPAAEAAGSSLYEQVYLDNVEISSRKEQQIMVTTNDVKGVA